MNEKRKYELKQRAERLAETRRQITEATVELHRTVGPAATRINEVARRAGVQRMTVYNHFPDEASLLAACSAHWRALHPAPDTEPMTANVLRDAEIGPALRPIIEGGLLAYLGRAREVLTEPLRVSERRSERVDAAARAAVDFHLWRALAPLGDADAAELAAGLVELAASE